MTALMAVAAFATASYAANQVQMTLTSPTIYKAGCEKIGSTTYSFDGNSEITTGDWWYMDLPENVTLCKNYNFIVAGNTPDPTACAANVTLNASGNYDETVFSGGAGISSFVAATVANGPVSASGTAKTFTVDGCMAFLVKGTSGSRRIAIYALTEKGANTTLTVNADSTFQMKLFDGKAFNLNSAADQTAGASVILLNNDTTANDRCYGFASATGVSTEVIGGTNATAQTAGEPYVENTLCANASAMSGQYLYTSYASRSDKFTFSGDSQIAHTAAASTIELASCKGSTSDTITITSGQTTVCAFDYNADIAAAATNGDYCTDGASAFQQKLIIKASTGAFGDISDKYYVTAEITDPSDGVYFGGDAWVEAYKSNEDACTDYTAGVVGDTLVGTGDWTYYEGSDTTTTIGDNNCTVNDGYRVDKLVQKNTTLFELDNYDKLWIGFSDFHYTNAAVAAGEEVVIEVTLNRWPCGEIFSDSITIGSFVTSCEGAEETTLYFPWLPGTGEAGWWGGFVITNVGDVQGAATLTYSDADGGQATYTTDAVAVGAQWTEPSTIAEDMTDVSGFDRSKNYAVKAECAFAAKGFAFTGNGGEGTGYLAVE